MALIRHDSRELLFTIVYFGAFGSGKTENLRYIHRRLDPHLRSDLRSAGEDSFPRATLDYLPVHTICPDGFRPRFRLQACPVGETIACEHKATLSAADGVIFVSDSDPDRLADNVRAHHGLRRFLASHDDPVPLVYQYNKRDLRGAVRPEILDEVYGVSSPSFLACALSGYQVFATLDHLVDHTLAGVGGVLPPEECRVEDSRVTVGSA